MAEGIFTVRIDPEKQQQIDQLARRLDRSRNYLVGQAIEEFLEAHAWQVEKIKAGLAAADPVSYTHLTLPTSDLV